MLNCQWKNSVERLEILQIVLDTSNRFYGELCEMERNITVFDGGDCIFSHNGSSGRVLHLLRPLARPDICNSTQFKVLLFFTF